MVAAFVHVYILQSYKTEDLSDISGISDDAGFHQLWIKIQVRNRRSLVICTAYSPPDAPVRCFDTDLTPSLIAASVYKPRHILGDLNRKPGALLEFCHFYNSYNYRSFLIDLTIKLMMIIKLLLDVSTLSSVIFKSCKVTVTW